MKIKIDEIGQRAQIEINPEDYFIVDTKDEEFPFGLAYRIDMSYKDKSDQWTQPVILLTEDEAEKFRGIIDEIS